MIVRASFYMLLWTPSKGRYAGVRCVAQYTARAVALCEIKRLRAKGAQRVLLYTYTLTNCKPFGCSL